MKETQTIEWKENWRDEFLKWICGFANAQGGTLFIGVDDKGNIIGVESPKKLLDDLPNKIKDILGILVEINLLASTENEKHYIEIKVPHYNNPISFKGRYYIRIGSTIQELTGTSLNDFLLKRAGTTWDSIFEQNASIDDLDLISINQFINDSKKVGRIQIEEGIDLIHLLEKLRIYENGLLKRAAIVLFAKDPGKFYPCLSVKIGRFGKSDADLKYHEVVEGNLIQMKEQIIQILNAKFFIHPIEFEGLQRIEKNQYPVDAVREMIFNALVHRNYSGAATQIRIHDNYISTWNDGGLPEGISEQDLWKTHQSKPRNPFIADVCFKAGYIDTWGRGTLKIIESCIENKLPDPVLKEEQGGFICQLFKSELTTKDQSDLKINLKTQQDEIIETIRDKYGINTGEIRDKYGIKSIEIIVLLNNQTGITLSTVAAELQISLSTVEKTIRKLSMDNIIKRIGSRKSGYWKINKA